MASPRKLPLALASLVVLLLLVGGGGYLFFGTHLISKPAIAQPLPFNHKLHTAKDVACNYCHERVEKGARATIPNLAVCMSCHNQQLGKSAVESEVRAYAAAKREIPWVRFNKLPGHVYFSHRAHVKYGAIQCASCHGEMGSQVEPVTHSQIASLTMTRCIACHKERQASTDCLTCHK